MTTLTAEESAIASSAENPGAAMAMRIVSGAAKLLGAAKLIPIASAHIDGCLYHGDSGTLFAEKLVAEKARVSVPATLNVGALDLLSARHVRLPSPAGGVNECNTRCGALRLRGGRGWEFTKRLCRSRRSIGGTRGFHRV